MIRFRFHRTLFAAILFAASMAGLAAQELTTATRVQTIDETTTEEQMREAALMREAAIEKFKEEHQLHTQLFKLNRIKPETMQSLARSEIKRYTLMQGASGGFYDSDEGHRRYANDRQLAEVRESAVAIPETNSILVTATEPTIQRIADLIQRIDSGDSAAPEIQPFRVEISLLRSMPKFNAASTSPTREVRVHTLTEGTIETNEIVVGKRIRKGDLLVRLSSDRVQGRIREWEGGLQQAEETLRLREELLAAEQNRMKAGVGNSETEAKLKIDVNEARKRIGMTEVELAEYLQAREGLTITSPVDGTIVEADHSLAVNAKIAANEYIATIAEPIATAAPAPGAAFDMERNQEESFGPLRLRLVRVERNEQSDPKDDSVELSINTGRQVLMATLADKEEKSVEGYRLSVENIVPSAMPNGDGSARILIEPGSQSNTTASSPFDLSQLGLAPADFREFGSASFSLLGRSVVSMAATTGNEGKAVVRIGDYQCALSYAGSQGDVTILRILLIADGETILESPVILNAAKPGILGITNLNDTLVFVVRSLE